MGYLFLILVFICGVLVLLNISFSFSKLDLLACGFPLGCGLWSLCLMAGDVMGLPKKYVAVSFILICITALFLRLYFKQGIALQNIKSGLAAPFNRIKERLIFYVKNPLKINLLYVFIFFLVSFIALAMVIKALYWPVINYDSINGFDFLAKLIKEENTLNSSIFSEENPAYSVRSLYPPLLVHALSIGYIFEMGNSKMIPVLYLLSTLLAVYSFIKKENSHLIAAIGVLLLCLTPAYMAFSSLVSSNTVASFYIFLGLASYDRWFRKLEKHYFFLALLALSLAVWTRTEAIIFAMAVGLTLLFKIRKTKEYSFWDWPKLANMLYQMYFIISQEVYFAFTFKIMLLVFIGNLIFLFKDKRMIPLSISLFLSALFTVFVYYQLDTSYNTFTESGWIGSGFKRGLFYFLPIGCYYIANSFLMRKALG